MFFDTREEVSDLGSDCTGDCSSTSALGDDVSDFLGFEVWSKNLGSVDKRCHKFLKWMGIGLDQHSVARDKLQDIYFEEDEIQIDRVIDNSGAVMRKDFEDGLLSSPSSRSCRSNEAVELVEDGALEEISV